MTVGLQNHDGGPESATPPYLRKSIRDPRPGLRWWLILFLVWSLSGVYEGAHLMRGWVPHDEGAFSQSADRVLRGELPHRDFTEIYTGGLTYLNAFAFRFLGESFATTRIVLFVFFLAWVPAVYWIASQLAPDWAAGGTTLLAVAWSLPNYSAAVPSWYNLFLATFGVAALLTYLRDRDWKWLFLAGLNGGLSFLVKTVALYYMAGAFLFFLFLEQSAEKDIVEGGKRRSPVYSVCAAGALLLFIVGLVRLIHKRGGVEAYVSFVGPAAVLVVLLFWEEVRIRGRGDRERFAALFRMLLPFGLGFSVPLVIFLIPYARAHALGSLFRGIFVLPIKRTNGAYEAPPALITVLPILIIAGILVVGAWVRGVARRLLSIAVALLFAFLLASSAWNAWHYRIAWYAASWVIPPLTIMGAIALGRAESRRGMQAEDSQQLFLLLSISALCSLVQFPFTSPIYFCYVAPLPLLALAALLRFFPRIPHPLVAVLYAGFLLFVMFRVTPTFIYDMRDHYERDTQTTPLDLPRAGGLRVAADSAAIYKKLIPLIQESAGTNEIYAAPDCPEVYFLAGYKNPTPTLFDFFDDPDEHQERILRMIDSRPIRVVVLDLDPSFSPPVEGEFYDALAERFPEKDTVGHFEVRWRR